MIKILFIMLVGVLGLEALEANEINNYTDNIYLSTKEFDKLVESNKEASDMEFYINDSFDVHRSNHNDMKVFSIINSQLIDDLELMVYYNFMYEDIKYSGEIYANSYIEKSNIENKIAEIKATVYDGSYYDSRANNVIQVNPNWKLVEHKKILKICDYKNEHYGDLEEWRSIYKLRSANKDYNYYAITTESTIIPELYKTDYRTDGIEYKITAPKEGVQLFYDGPRFKNEDAQISYSVHAGAGVIDNNNSIISSEINISYPTLVDSPIVIKNPTPRNEYQIYMDYTHPFDDSGLYYQYNINESYQCVALVLIADAKLNKIELKDDRKLEIQRDGFWSNSLGKFTTSSNIVIEN